MVKPDGTMRTLAEIEAAAIDFALTAYRSRKSAAKALGIGRTTLYRKIEDLQSH
ncbi:MAG TPA: helix-turn-helix domain-containing protein [Allosphingosinicella sp.]